MRVTGIGGIFFKAKDPQAMSAWYRQHLHINLTDGYTVFAWGKPDTPNASGSTVFSFFPEDTQYFQPSEKPFMINFRVENLMELLLDLRAEGVEVIDKMEEHEYGKFGWIIDLEGNKIELWEPMEGM